MKETPLEKVNKPKQLKNPIMAKDVIMFVVSCLAYVTLVVTLVVVAICWGVQ